MEGNIVRAGYRWSELYILLRMLIGAFRVSSARNLSAICSDLLHAMSRFLPHGNLCVFSETKTAAARPHAAFPRVRSIFFRTLAPKFSVFL